MRFLSVISTAVALLLTTGGVIIAQDEDLAPSHGGFEPTGALTLGRTGHTATPLPDGRVLIVGGSGPDGAVAAAEVWEPEAGNAALSTPMSVSQQPAGVFSLAGSLAEGRQDHAAVLLQDGRVLIVGGRGYPVRASAEMWDPVTASFVPAGSLVQRRLDHTATLLADGRVLIVGGWDGNDTFNSAEVWDPAMASFEPAGWPGRRRLDHSATLLADGRVLIAGGWGNDSAELWDPAISDFAPAGTLLAARVDHTATLLPDGRVLVIGGRDPFADDTLALATSELWDPTSESFRPTGSLGVARSGHTATLLSDGRVLVIGGEGSDEETLSAAEVWDPATGSFGSAGVLAEARSAHAAVALHDDHVLVVGGEGEGYANLESAEIWDPVTATFGPAGSLARSRWDHTATLLPDGRVLVAGAHSNLARIAEIWDPVTATFGPAASITEPRAHHTATALPDGRVLLVGGVGPTFIPSAEIWDPAASSFGSAGELSATRSDYTTTLLPDGRVLVRAPLGFEPQVWDPATTSFGLAGPLAGSKGDPDEEPLGPRTHGTETLLPDGRVLIVGGVGEDGYLASAEVWDPATGASGPAGSLAEARWLHTATLLPDGRVLVVGGTNVRRALASAEVWDPASATFAPAGSLATERSLHTATLLPDGRVLVIGGEGGAYGDGVPGVPEASSAEIWDPKTSSFARAGSLGKSRTGHAATLLSDGRVLVTGGWAGGRRYRASAEVWEPLGASALEAEMPPAVDAIAFRSFREGDDEVFSMAADGSSQTNLTDRGSAEGRVLAWSPDGSRIAYLSTWSGSPELWVMDANGAGQRQLTSSPGEPFFMSVPTWSPDGTHLAFASNRDGPYDVYVLGVDESGPDDMPPLLNLTHDPAQDGLLGLDWSPDGTRIAFTSDRDGNTDVFVMGADGSDVDNLTHSAGSAFEMYHNTEPDWSPDGTRIAFTPLTGLASDIYVMDADGSDVTDLTHSTDLSSEELVGLELGVLGVSNMTPLWSPDGVHIAFSSTRDGDTDPEFPAILNADLYVMEADGSGVINVTDDPGNDIGASWSPDGTRIVFESDRGGNTDVYVVDVDGSDLTRLTTDPAYDGGPAWAPRSKRRGNT